MEQQIPKGRVTCSKEIPILNCVGSAYGVGSHFSLVSLILTEDFLRFLFAFSVRDPLLWSRNSDGLGGDFTDFQFWNRNS